MSHATPASIAAALSAIEACPSPDYCRTHIDSATGEPCFFSLGWQLGDPVVIHFRCTPGKMALVGITRALWLSLDDIFIDDKPVGSGGVYRVAFPEPMPQTDYRLLDDDGQPAAVDGLTEALNAALAVPLRIG